MNLNGSTTVWDAAKVRSISINGFNGNDKISVEGTEDNDTNSVPLVVNTTITDGNGNNTIGTGLSDSARPAGWAMSKLVTGTIN